MRMRLEKLIRDINGAESTSQLIDCHKLIDQQVKYVFPELTFSHMRDIFKEINSLHVLLKSKALELAAKDQGIDKDGSFCWGMMGSGAREEQTVKTDQDNCLLYTDEKLGFDIDEFSSAGIQSLWKAGYPLCTGNVMATNPRWKFSVGHIKHSRPIDELYKDARYVFILLDLVPLYGNESLLFSFREKVISEIKQKEDLQVKMKAAAAGLQVPIGPFGRIYVERYGSFAGKFNIKAGVYAPLVIALKYLSLLHGIGAVNNYCRLDELRRCGAIDESFSQELSAALDILLYFRLRQSTLFQFDEEIHDFIAIENLTKKQLGSLKKAMRTVQRLQSHVKKRGGRHEAFQ